MTSDVKMPRAKPQDRNHTVFWGCDLKQPTQLNQAECDAQQEHAAHILVTPKVSGNYQWAQRR